MRIPPRVPDPSDNECADQPRPPRTRSHRFARTGDRGRGQALVEMALILPLLLVLVVGGIDFGRIFFGSVGLQNAARVAANYAALHPNAWGTPGNLAEQAVYEGQIRDDAAAINCVLPSTLPEPQFPDGKDLGDHAMVTLSCQFGLVTPFLEGLVGGPVPVGASASFPIRSGCSACPTGSTSPGPTPSGPTPVPTPTPPCSTFVPDMEGMTVAGARSAWTSAGFTGPFSPDTGHNGDLVVTQVTTPPSNPNDCIPADSSVVVTYEPPPTPAPTCAIVPDLFAQLLPDARTQWTAAGFTGTFTPASPEGDAEWVVSQTTSAAAQPGECVDFTTTVTVTYGPQPTPTPTPTPCIVPSFIGTSSTEAQATWDGAGFSTQVQFEAAGQLPYTIQRQSLVGGSSVVCWATITVGRQS
ncbi:MAG TPA: TadE/TadG family type IV pilus assembly protein [Candidatus Limnocylindria bacterium]